MSAYQPIINFIRSLYKTQAFIPLHEPSFSSLEKKYVNEAIDSTYVSSVGAFVDKFEQDFTEFVGAKYSVAVVNGTAALHTNSHMANVSLGDEVITQPLTFVATCNTISYCGASPIFVDVDEDTLGLSPNALRSFLEKSTYQQNNNCINKNTSKIIRACVPMHTFGHPVRIDEIVEVCSEFNIAIIEDAAESFGSTWNGKHTGTFGQLSAFSFNGNKIMTTGGGGMIVTNDEELAIKAKHITTTAKVPHKWEFNHDQVAFNYRMPNLNAALGCAQLEQMADFLKSKKDLAQTYKEYFQGHAHCSFISEVAEAESNYWLNTLRFKNINQRDEFLELANSSGVMSRPSWSLMSDLPMFRTCEQADDLGISRMVCQQLVNIPSSPLRN